MKTSCALLLTWVVTLAAASAVEPLKLDKPLLARWTFDEATGGVCRDASDHGGEASSQKTPAGFERVPAGSDELLKDNPVTVYRQPAAGRPTAADAWYRMRVLPVAGKQPACEADRSRVMQVDARILPDHGTIFTPAFMEFVIRSFNRGVSPRP